MTLYLTTAYQEIGSRIVRRNGDVFTDELSPAKKFCVLKTFKKYRDILSPSYSYPITIDGLTWTSVLHYVYAQRFKNYPAFYRSFARESESQTSESAIYAIHYGADESIFRPKDIIPDMSVDLEMANFKANMIKFLSSPKMSLLLTSTKDTELIYIPENGDPVIRQKTLELVRTFIVNISLGREIKVDREIKEGEIKDELEEGEIAVDELQEEPVPPKPEKKPGQYFLHKPLSDYGNAIKLLGRGTYGRVDLYRHPTTHKEYAVKFETAGISHSFLHESSILLQLNHPNIVNIIDVGIVSDESHEEVAVGIPYMVLELADQDLYSLTRKHVVDKKQMKNMMYQMAQGMAYLASEGILHRDLKPSNVLVYRDKQHNCYRVKLADFGISGATYCDVKDRDVEAVFTPIYMPPEVILGDKSYTSQADVWSLGAIYYEMIAKQYLIVPTGAMNLNPEKERLKAIIKYIGLPNDVTWPGHINLPRYKEFEKELTTPPIQSVSFDNIRNYDVQLADLISQLIRWDPKKRLSAFEIVNHPFFKDVDHNCIVKTDSVPISCDKLLNELLVVPEIVGNLNDRKKFLIQFVKHVRKWQIVSSAEVLFHTIQLFDIVYPRLPQLTAEEIIDACLLLSTSYITNLNATIALTNQYSLDRISELTKLVLDVAKYKLYISTPFNYLPQNDNLYSKTLNTLYKPVVVLLALVVNGNHLGGQTSYEKLADISMNINKYEDIKKDIQPIITDLNIRLML